MTLQILILHLQIHQCSRDKDNQDNDGGDGTMAFEREYCTSLLNFSRFTVDPIIERNASWLNVHQSQFKLGTESQVSGTKDSKLLEGISLLHPPHDVCPCSQELSQEKFLLAL